MIYFCQFGYKYDYVLALFVHTDKTEVSPAVLMRSDTLFVVQPNTVQVLKNEDGAHYANMANANWDLAAATPQLQPKALMLVDEQELERFIAADCPSYYEWKWETLREWKP